MTKRIFNPRAFSVGKTALLNVTAVALSMSNLISKVSLVFDRFLDDVKAHFSKTNITGLGPGWLVESLDGRK